MYASIDRVYRRVIRIARLPDALRRIRLPIATKVHAAFGVLLLSLLALGMVYLERLGAMNAEAVANRDDWLPSERALGQLRATVRQYRIEEAGVLLADSPRELAINRAHLQEAGLGVERARAAVQPLITPATADERYMRDFDRAWADYRASSERLARDAAAGGTAQMLRRAYHAEVAVCEAAIAAVAGNIAFNHGEGLAAEGRAIHAYAVTRRIIMAAFMGALLTSAVLGALLSRTLARPVRLLTRAMERLAAKDYGIEIPARQRGDELGAMAAALEEFRKRLIETDELRELEDARRADLAASEERFRTVFESAVDGIFLTDPATGRFVDVNPAACAMTGYSREELIGRDILSVSSGVAPYDEAGAAEWIRKTQAAGPQTFEWHSRTRDGRLYWTEISIRFVHFGTRYLVLATLRDIDARKQAEEHIQRLARYDVLTGLPNRAVFVEAVAQAAARTRRSGASFAVLFLDLDHFKDVNDTLGHPAGDELLRQVAARLHGAVRESDVIARFGGDEFAVLASEPAGPNEAAALANKLIRALEPRIAIEGRELRIGTSIGIALPAAGKTDAESLLSHADVALYRAKAEGRGDYRFFTEAMDVETRARVTLIAELRAAIGNDQIFVVYQPQVSLATGEITGIEALVRWRHPTRGVLGPDKFIHEAESSGLMAPIGRRVLDEACRQAAAWHAGGILPANIAVNLSAVELRAPQEAERSVLAALAATGLPAERLEIELTESVLMGPGEHHQTVARLRSRGVRLAIDDFGTGYSSLDYLRRFPADRIKIPYCFTQLAEPRSAAVVKATISLARELGMGVIAEGIETRAQADELRAWGCPEGQGFYYAQPMTPEQLSPLLRAGVIRPGPVAVKGQQAA